MTAKPHPSIITTQLFAKGTGETLLNSANVATQPSPKRISTIVPKNSAMVSPKVPAKALEVDTDREAMNTYSFFAVAITTVHAAIAVIDNAYNNEFMRYS